MFSIVLRTICGGLRGILRDQTDDACINSLLLAFLFLFSHTRLASLFQNGNYHFPWLWSPLFSYTHVLRLTPKMAVARWMTLALLRPQNALRCLHGESCARFSKNYIKGCDEFALHQKRLVLRSKKDWRFRDGVWVRAVLENIMVLW
jgi:hypothetical protein